MDFRDRAREGCLLLGGPQGSHSRRVSPWWTSGTVYKKGIYSLTDLRGHTREGYLLLSGPQGPHSRRVSTPWGPQGPHSSTGQRCVVGTPDNTSAYPSESWIFLSPWECTNIFCPKDVFNPFILKKTYCPRLCCRSESYLPVSDPTVSEL